MPQPNGRFDILSSLPSTLDTRLPITTFLRFLFPSGPFSFRLLLFVPFLFFCLAWRLRAFAGVLSPPDTLTPLPPYSVSSFPPTSNLNGDGVAMSTGYQDLSDGQGSPAPSNAGSTGTSGITVPNGPQGQPLSFRR